MTFPGVVRRVEAHGESTVVVEPADLIEAATYLRDEEGFNFLSDITAVDYLGWASTPVSGTSTITSISSRRPSSVNRWIWNSSTSGCSRMMASTARG